MECFNNENSHGSSYAQHPDTLPITNYHSQQNNLTAAKVGILLHDQINNYSHINLLTHSVTSSTVPSWTFYTRFHSTLTATQN